MNIIEQLDQEQIAKLSEGREIPHFQPGDTVQVNVKVKEGERSRVQAYEAALQHGQIERAVMAAHNAAAALQSLSELELALQWLERGIALARESGWPVSLALSLGQSGETDRKSVV